MRGREQTFLSDLIGPEERAIEAVVSRYQRVAPAVTRFARTLAKNPNLRVRLGSEAAASDDEVVCDPRIFQAAYTRNAPVTPDEVALASALHEVMHLVTTNLDETRELPGELAGRAREPTRRPGRPPHRPGADQPPRRRGPVLLPRRRPSGASGALGLPRRPLGARRPLHVLPGAGDLLDPAR